MPSTFVRIGGAAASAFTCLLLPSLAVADGNEEHALTYSKSGAGLGLATAGVGLAGRREVGGDAPTTSAELVLGGVPSGATVERAYLYWTVLGAADASVTLEGKAITGTLIGTSAGTCWATPAWAPAAPNRVYRADVTADVTGNGAYTFAGYPSVAAASDGQGASLVVAYTDATDARVGELVLHDGASTLTNVHQFSVTLPAPKPGTADTLELYLGVGDGQANLPDGTLYANEVTVTKLSDAFFAGSAGSYWDSLVIDLEPYVELDGTDITIRNEYGVDCLVFAYSALLSRVTIEDADDDGVHDPIDNCPGVKNASQANHDADKFGDACDNCPRDPNFGQEDLDQDGAGDACDSCVELANPNQANYDADRLGDACDNCPCVFNSNQEDSNGNDVGDACDPASGGDDMTCDLTVPNGAGGADGASGASGVADAGDSPTGNTGGGGDANGGAGAKPVDRGDAGETARGGRNDDGAGGAFAGEASGSAIARDDGGCGCRVPAPASTHAGLAALALAVGWLRRRRSARRD